MYVCMYQSYVIHTMHETNTILDCSTSTIYFPSYILSGLHHKYILIWCQNLNGYVMYNMASPNFCRFQIFFETATTIFVDILKFIIFLLNMMNPKLDPFSTVVINKVAHALLID